MTTQITRFFAKKQDGDDMEIVSYLPLETLRESQYNMYASQQICTVRDFSMEEYYDEQKNGGSKMTDVHQILYDMGCALIYFEIVVKNGKGEFVLNSNFSDYHDWKYSKFIIENCKFLAKMGHPLFQ